MKKQLHVITFIFFLHIISKPKEGEVRFNAEREKLSNYKDKFTVHAEEGNIRQWKVEFPNVKDPRVQKTEG